MKRKKAAVAKTPNKYRFIKNCENPLCWHWLMPDGTKHFHFESSSYQLTGIINHQQKEVTEKGARYKGGAGPCPICGNQYTNCETVLPEPVLSKNS